jgi:hypothetical protein
MQFVTLPLSQFLTEYPNVDEDTLFKMVRKREPLFLLDKLEKDFYLTILLIHI